MMWSENKKIDLLINVLIFCVSLNVFHLGQLLLPIICVIIFVDHKCKLTINNLTVFVLLCLFGLTFFLFSFKLGFYSVMGFCLPMAYYIGQNLNRSEANIKKMIYIIALGMGIHVILNMAYDFTIFGTDLLNHRSHYDIWLQDETMLTAVAINYVVLTGSIYYLFFKEKNISIKVGLLCLYIIMMIYNIGLGRRTPILMFGVVFLLSVVFDYFIFGSNKKALVKMVTALIFVLMLMAVIWVSNIFGIREALIHTQFISKFREYGLNSGRLEIVVDSFKLIPQYLWGGQHISSILEIQIHNLWLDIYDYAGIIPFILMIIFTLYEIVGFIKLLINKKISRDFKILLIGVYAACFIQAMLEPLMTGASIFLICMVMMFSGFEGFNAELDKN